MLNQVRAPGVTASIGPRYLGRRLMSEWIECQGCPVVYPILDSIARTEAYLRAKEWHIFHGESLTGQHMDVYLCSKCVGSPRKKLDPAPPALEGQLELDL